MKRMKILVTPSKVMTYKGVDYTLIGDNGWYKLGDGDMQTKIKDLFSALKEEPYMFNDTDTFQAEKTAVKAAEKRIDSLFNKLRKRVPKGFEGVWKGFVDDNVQKIVLDSL